MLKIFGKYFDGRFAFDVLGIKKWVEIKKKEAFLKSVMLSVLVFKGVMGNVMGMDFKGMDFNKRQSIQSLTPSVPVTAAMIVYDSKGNPVNKKNKKYLSTESTQSSDENELSYKSSDGSSFEYEDSSVTEGGGNNLSVPIKSNPIEIEYYSGDGSSSDGKSPEKQSSSYSYSRSPSFSQPASPQATLPQKVPLKKDSKYVENDDDYAERVYNDLKENSKYDDSALLTLVQERLKEQNPKLVIEIDCANGVRDIDHTINLKKENNLLILKNIFDTCSSKSFPCIINEDIKKEIKGNFYSHFKLIFEKLGKMGILEDGIVYLAKSTYQSLYEKCMPFNDMNQFKKNIRRGLEETNIPITNFQGTADRKGVKFKMDSYSCDKEALKKFCEDFPDKYKSKCKLIDPEIFSGYVTIEKLSNHSDSVFLGNLKSQYFILYMSSFLSQMARFKIDLDLKIQIRAEARSFLLSYYKNMCCYCMDIYANRNSFNQLGKQFMGGEPKTVECFNIFISSFNDKFLNDNYTDNNTDVNFNNIFCHDETSIKKMKEYAERVQKSFLKTDELAKEKGVIGTVSEAISNNIPANLPTNLASTATSLLSLGSSLYSMYNAGGSAQANTNSGSTKKSWWG